MYCCVPVNPLEEETVIKGFVAVPGLDIYPWLLGATPEDFRLSIPTSGEGLNCLTGCLFPIAEEL